MKPSASPSGPGGEIDAGRVGPIDPSRLSVEQREVFDRIRDSRGDVVGPFTVLLHAPVLADHVQRLGAYLRYETHLERDLAEAAVLVVARAWSSEFEWAAHEPIAREAGTPDEVVETIRAGTAFERLPDRYRIVCTIARSLACRERIGSEEYEAAVELLGVPALVELTVLVGYYVMLAMTLATHRVDGAAERS
ncbi:MAG: carboxymuconolactone decarboxylase family protein [Chloroflexi bacterium]|nr:carboxymuconolactone decarboxylase family protein [Chloroflexota bacterium]